MLKNSNFENFLANIIDGLPESRVSQAMSYSLFTGGKRLRPRLLFSIANSFGADYKEQMICGSAIEMIHTYSLIHDDLPAMDNDVLRRGKKTCHVEFDEATAILAGDALLTHAFTILKDLDLRHISSVIDVLGTASGAIGMILGQDYDVQTDNILNFEALKLNHSLKTGQLFASSLMIGAIVSDQSCLIPQLNKIGLELGLAFQIQNDINELIKYEENEMRESDIRNRRCTAVSLLGLNGAKMEFDKCYNNINIMIGHLPRKFPSLENIIIEIIERV